MKKRTRQYWVDTLALFDPKDVGPTRPRSKVYMGMVKAGIPFYDRVAINREAAKLYRERRRPAEKTARLAMGYGAGVSRYGRNLPKYGGRLTEETAQRAVGKVPELAMGYCGDTMQYAEGRTCEERRRYGNAFIKFNTEGEKQMEKIDWKKPLRALDSVGEPQDGEARTYKSGKQRVVWVDDRVYPVDDQGRAVAEVWYSGDRQSRPRVGALKGSRLVENAPGEEFFLGLTRDSDGIYWLAKCGRPTTMGVMNKWKTFVTDQPHWIVDTRKSAELPKEVVHDPKDYVTIWEGRNGSTQVSGEVMTKAEAEAYVSEPGERVVRVRTTPAPADTARYIHLYRKAGSAGPWQINDFSDGRQEMTASKTREQANGHGNEHYVVKVRD